MSKIALETNRVRLVTVGDGGCGKTALLTVFVENRFPTVYIPTVFDFHSKTIALFDERTRAEVRVDMSLNDTAGQETYAGLRPITYFDMDVIVLCFDVSRPESLANVEELWTPELYNYAPDLPVILVACKTDLRHDPATHEVLGRVGMGPVTRKEGEAMAARIGARAYVECSAVWNVNVTDVFEAAAKAALDKAARRREGGRGFKRGFKRRLQEYRERCKIL